MHIKYFVICLGSLKEPFHREPALEGFRPLRDAKSNPI